MAIGNETVAILFDIDGTLISTMGAVAWRRAFDELYGSRQATVSSRTSS